MTPTISFSPLFGTSVGFDRFDDLFDKLTRTSDTEEAGPSYDIQRLDEDRYAITIAVAGFEDSDLKITTHDNELVVAGERPEDQRSDNQYLYQGIGLRHFKRTFRLDDYVRVTNAELKNGLLRIALVREVPEEQKPRRIEIRTKPDLKAIENSTKKVA